MVCLYSIHRGRWARKHTLHLWPMNHNSTFLRFITTWSQHRANMLLYKNKTVQLAEKQQFKLKYTHMAVILHRMFWVVSVHTMREFSTLITFGELLCSVEVRAQHKHQEAMGHEHIISKHKHKLWEGAAAAEMETQRSPWRRQTAKVQQSQQENRSCSKSRLEMRSVLFQSFRNNYL